MRGSALDAPNAVGIGPERSLFSNRAAVPQVRRVECGKRVGVQGV
jgi:hypothetical protein